MGYLYRPKLRSGKPGRIWRAKWYENGKPVRVSTGATKRGDAKRFLELREGERAKGNSLPPRLDRITYDELAHDLREHYRTTGQRNIREVEFRLAHLDKFFRGRRAVSIGPSLITAYINHRQEQIVSNRTVNIELAVLKKMLNLAYRNGKLLRVPPFGMLKEAPPRQGFFERNQYEAILRNLPEDIKPVVTFAYLTGWRIPSEVLRLTWAQVDFKGGVVRLEPGMGKTGEPRTFPMFPELRALLEAQRSRTDALQREQSRIIPWVFHRSGERIKNFTSAWRTACRRAGVPGRIPHGFRRTAVRNSVRAGVPERVAMALSGHRSRSVFERYNIVSEGDLQEASRKLSGTFRARSSPSVPISRV